MLDPPASTENGGVFEFPVCVPEQHELSLQRTRPRVRKREMSRETEDRGEGGEEEEEEEDIDKSNVHIAPTGRRARCATDLGHHVGQVVA